MSIFNGKKDFFALAFSDDFLRLAQADQKGNLKVYLEQPLPPGTIERGVVKNKEVLAKVVFNLLTTAKIKQKFVVVGLPEIKAFSRVLTLPALPLEELDDAVRWQVEPLLPLPLEKTYLDWMILEKLKDKFRVSVVALPEGLVESYAKILEGLGFQPVAFEIDSLSLARLIGRSETASVVIELKKKEAVLAIVNPNGGVEASSTLDFEGSEGQEELFSTLQNLLGFFQKTQKRRENGQKIGKIVLCGEGAGENWARAIGQKTGLPTEILKIRQVNLASLVSLAQKEVASPADEKTINLIPPRIQGLYDRTARVREISLWLKLALFMLLLVFFAYGTMAAHAYFELKKIEGRVVELQSGITPESTQVEKEVENLNARAKQVVSLAAGRPEVVPLLSLIGKISSPGVEVRHCFFDADKGRIFINGTARHRDDLLTFRRQLENTNQFAEIHIPLSSLGKEENVDFAIWVVGKSEP